MTWAALITLLMMFVGGIPPEADEEIVELDNVEVEATAPETVADSNSAKLRWNNFESLSGELSGATATDLSWKSPLFDQPLRLRWDAVRRLDQTVPTTAAPESFSVSLRDGSHLIGELVAMDADTVTMKSARHGDVVLKRPEVLRIVRLRGEKIIAAGPAGDVGWKTGGKLSNEGPNPKVPQIVTAPGGALSFPYWNTDATFEVTLPARTEFDVDLRFTAAPAFSLKFDGDHSANVRLETWDDELVVTNGEEFQLIRKIDPAERAIALHVCWDGASGKGIVFNGGGEQLAQWSFKAARGQGKGWVLQNKGRRLTLMRFSIREWDGKTLPAKADTAPSGVRLADGRLLPGSEIGVAADSVKVGSETCALGDVSEIVFSKDEPKAAATATALSFADSTLCFGRIVSIAGERAALETSFTAAPLQIALTGLRQLRTPESKDKPQDAPDEIQLDGITLRGTMTTGENGRLQWLPVGGVSPATPKASSTLKITRKTSENQPKPLSPALFYTAFGDILPGNFRGVSDAGVEIESEIVDSKTLPVGCVDAVQFADGPQPLVKSFDAPGWRIVSGGAESVRVSKNTLEIDPGGAFAHPLMMQNDSFEFSLDPQDCGAFRIRFFSGGATREPTTNLLIAPTDSMVFLSVQEGDGEENGYQTRNSVSGTVKMQFEIKDSTVTIRLNDRMIQRVPISPKRKLGSGIVFDQAATNFGAEGLVKLTDFSSAIGTSSIWLPDINAEMKTQALTVPRFRKERPPRHALVASNGDVLRGEIETTTASHFSFLSGLEKLRIPRDRVSAAIWLKPPGNDATPEAAVTADALQLTFPRNIQYGGTSLTTLLSVITREIPGVTINNRARDSGNRRVTMRFSQQTVGSLLDQICNLFDVRYRVEENGSITIESGQEPAKQFIEKSYWLKAGTFADSAAAQARLVEKGIEFPEGAKARWEADSRQLIVKSSPATQAKIDALLKKEYGTGYTVLTHWLLLANGGRIGLTVEKFGKDFIVGTHPEYGRCRIATPLVAGIQTAKPSATTAMTALANWRLRPAREPVIPESGGESSPTLAKEAPTFKLPLFGGGEFDLKAEQGKVIVLDFWATWCGPCIKSLPGLIEAISAFPADRVKLIGLNQGEPADTVKRFIETRGWKFTVAMDSTQKVAQQYGVSGIPHTVIVGPDGKVAWVKTGYSPEGPAEAAEAIKKLLEAPAAAAK